MLNALFVLDIFILLSWLFGHAGKSMFRNWFHAKIDAKIDFKIFIWQAVQKIIKTYILRSIWRNKCNLAMEFGQLIEYNVRNIFL